MTTSTAYLLVIHGSRNRKTQIAASKLKQMLIAELKSKSKDILCQLNYPTRSFPRSESTIVNLDRSPQNPLIDVAALELASLPLSENIINFAQTADYLGFKKIKIIPLFLVPGVHVTEDIPIEITRAIKQTNNQVTIELSPYLGKYSGMISLLAQKFSQLSAKTRILIAHGSRLPGVADYYQSLTGQLDAMIAYWSTTPNLNQQVKAQIAAGQRKIAILPYFLFPGKITEAIAKQVSELQLEHPKVELILGEPLGATPALAELIAQKF